MSVWIQWCAMSALMVGPLVVLIAYRTKHVTYSVLVDVIGAFAVWAAFGVPIAALCVILEPVGNVVGAVLLATAASLQFTQAHERALEMCNESAGTKIANGVRIGWACLISCGPLMVAMFVVGAHGVAVMAVASALMIAEFVVPFRALVTRGLGVGIAAAAAAVLFLGYVPSPGGALNSVHSHHVG